MPDPAVVLESADVRAGEPAYGLRRNVLSPLEVLAQSVSVIAPCTTPPADHSAGVCAGRRGGVAGVCTGHGARWC